METSNTSHIVKHELSQIIELGNNAGKNGNIQESFQWYMKGLSLAQQLKDTESIKKLSGLLALTL